MGSKLNRRFPLVSIFIPVKNHSNNDFDQKVLRFAGSNFFSYSNPGSNGTHNLIFHELSFCFSEVSHIFCWSVIALAISNFSRSNIPMTSTFQNFNWVNTIHLLMMKMLGYNDNTFCPQFVKCWVITRSTDILSTRRKNTFISQAYFTQGHS